MIPIDLIDVPEGRPIDHDNVEALTKTLTLDGQLHPIGIRPYDDGLPEHEGRFELVHGRHRLEAAKRLGWAEIEATELHENGGGGGDIQTAVAAENLFRMALNPAERMIALTLWQAKYDAAYPQASGSGSTSARRKVEREAAARGEEPPPHGKSFNVTVADATGRDKTSVQRDMQAKGDLSVEDLAVLADRNVARNHIAAISKLHEEDRPRAISLIAGGMAPPEAIERAGLPEGAVVTVHPKGGDRPNIEEDELSDDAWLETYCGEVLARLKYATAFRADALLYRKTSAAREQFRKDTLRALKQASAGPTGDVHYKITQVVNLEHPRSWLPCGPCGATGKTDRGTCETCYGRAYKAGSARRRLT